MRTATEKEILPFQTISEGITRYLVLVLAYTLITYLVYACRYAKAKKNLKKYYGGLKALNAMYHEES